jgi:hypothetical protein
LAKIKVEMLPLIGGNSARTLGEVVLEVEETFQETLELVELTDVYAVSELVEEFDKRCEPLDSGFDFRLEDLDAVFALDFLEVNKNRLRNDRSGRGGCGRRETVSERNFEAGGKGLFVCLFAFGVGSTTSSSFFELAAESKAVFTLGRAWTTTSSLNKGKINRTLIKGDRSRDETCDSTNVCVGVPVRLAGLTVHVEGLVDGRGQ